MSPDEEPSPQSRKWLLPVLVVLALYLISYFPTLSYMVRHPEHRRFSAVYRPIPLALRHFMFKVWKKLDPPGFQIVDRQAAAHPNG